jgi:formylmethanofuran dehydrogenase subunit C
MKPVVFTRREMPDQRIDLSALTPARLKGLSSREIERLPINTMRHALVVGDVFRIRAGNPVAIRIEGAVSRFDCVGLGMDAGSIAAEGDVGELAGRLMSGGTLTIRGDAGPWAGSGMKGGRLAIEGNAGDWLGGPLPGEMAGMRGGVLTVARNAGEMAGDRLRRGVVAIRGSAGAYAGCRMIAGTLLIGGHVGAYPGYLMKRGALLLRRAPGILSPTFVETGEAGGVFRRLLARSLRQSGVEADWVERGTASRFAGDTAVLGKGELFLIG